MGNDVRLNGRRAGRPVKLLAIFMPGDVPIPRKFIWDDGKGYTQTIVVDEVISTFVATNHIEYKCISYFENVAKRYDLTYWKDENQWELYLL